MNTQVQKFSRIFYEELEKEDWGDIDPYIFKSIADDSYDAEDSVYITEVEAMNTILERTLERMKNV